MVEFYSFLVSQDSAATHLSRGGQHDMIFVPIFWRIQRWKNFQNQPTSVEVMDECIVAHFWLTVYIIQN